MADDRHVDFEISRWFEADAPPQLPDRVLRDAFERTRRTRQQPRWREFLGRLPVNPIVRSGLVPAGIVTAVVAVTLVAGIAVLNPRSFGVAGTGPSAPVGSAVPSGSGSVAPGLPVGPHLLWDASGAGGQLAVTIAAPGWFGGPNEGFLIKNESADGPDGAGLIVFAQAHRSLAGEGDLYVYGDPCHWETTKPAAPAKTVAAAVAALSRQASRSASAASPITVDGRAGQAITLHVPADARFDTCDLGEFRTLTKGPDGERYAQSPGQIDTLWIVDAGDPLGVIVIDMGYYTGTPAAVVQEMETIAASMTFN